MDYSKPEKIKSYGFHCKISKAEDYFYSDFKILCLYLRFLGTGR